MKQHLRIRPNPRVAALRPYSPGRTGYDIDLFLDANEAVRAPDGLAQVLVTGDGDLCRYPSAALLEARIARGLGVDPAAVLVTAGADDALERAIRSVCSPGRTAILTRPSFEMLGRYAALAGAEVVELEWWQGEWPVGRALELACSETALVAVVSPNNPTGAVISRQAFSRLADSMPESLILLDHAYVEFADEDLTADALRRANVLVFRTMSKAWACAGLRVGWVAGDPRVVSWLRALGQPYPVARPSLDAAAWVLDGAWEQRRTIVTEVCRQRAALARRLRSLGVEVLPSAANFVLARFGAAAKVRDAFAALGIAVRAFDGRSDLEDWVRITLPGDRRAFERLEKSVQTILEPQAVLFDMDGVLADVSCSYRAAIIETAAMYGVAVTSSDIAGAKAAGNSNNDWQLTRRLLAERGVERPLDEVTTRFEGLYQGGNGQPGFRSRERLLFSRGDFEALSRRLPIAVVTGRPKKDADRFLAENGLDGLVSAVVCMEDAPDKPDPAPVRLALDRLGVSCAWMLGDTPDDVRAARSAGVLPVGVLAPGDGADAARSLLKAGAAQVLGRADQILEVLPCR